MTRAFRRAPERAGRGQDPPTVHLEKRCSPFPVGEVGLPAGHASVQAMGESIYHGLAPALMPAALKDVRAHLEKLKTDGLVTEESGQWRR